MRRLAEEAGCAIQHDCGGYRVVREIEGGWRYLYPNSGICPTQPRKACEAFLLGMLCERRERKEQKP